MKNEKRSPRIKETLGSLTQDLIDAGLGSPFTEKELNYYGIKIPEIKEIPPKKIQTIRKKVQLSQSVFARLLNVSAASIKQWEQGTRNPTGSTKVLLDLLDKISVYGHSPIKNIKSAFGEHKKNKMPQTVL